MKERREGEDRRSQTRIAIAESYAHGNFEQPKSLTWTTATTISVAAGLRKKKEKSQHGGSHSRWRRYRAGKAWSFRAARCQPEIPGRLAPLENRLAAVRVVRSAILEAGRTQRNNKIEPIIDFPPSSHRSWGKPFRYHRKFALVARSLK